MKNEVREMSIRKRKNGFGISSDAGEILFKEFETADWLSKDEENDLLREAKGDGKLGFDEQVFLERINGTKKDLVDSSGNSNIDKFNEYGKIDLLKMAQNGSDNDLRWKPQNDNEWQSRMYATNTAQATDLSNGGKNGNYNIRPTKVYLVVENYPAGTGHVQIVFADQQGSTMGYGFGPWPAASDGKSSSDWWGPGRIIVEKNALNRVNEHGGYVIELEMTENEIFRTKDYFDQLENDKDSFYLYGTEHIYGDIDRKFQVSKGKSAQYMLIPWEGQNCVRNSLGALIYGYGANSSKGQKLKGLVGTDNFYPHSLSSELRKNGMDYGVVRHYEEKNGRLNYQKMQDAGMP